MDLEFLTPLHFRITDSLISAHLPALALHTEGGRGGSSSWKGSHARNSTSSTLTTRVTITVPTKPWRHPRPVTTSSIPIKRLPFIEIPACSLNFLHTALKTKSQAPPPPTHTLQSPSPAFAPFYSSRLCCLLYIISQWLCLKWGIFL